MLSSKIRHDELNAAIGARIRIARKRKSLSLRQLSALVGCSYQMLQKIERGENRLSAARLILVAQSLKVSIASLIPDDVGDGTAVSKKPTNMPTNSNNPFV